MKKILITVLFDIEHDRQLEERDFDRFIVESSAESFREKLFDVFEEKKYAWDDFEKINKGYKAIMEIEQLDLTDLDVY